MIQCYMICPVRKATEAQREKIDRYVTTLEENSERRFHHPPRDVDQANDDGGVRICRRHRVAMLDADEVHVWWEESSSGCHFDLGMAYILQRSRRERPLKIILANPEECPQDLARKSFTNLLWSTIDADTAESIRSLVQ